jgi:hypothetical protein
MRVNSHSFIRFDTDRQVDASLSMSRSPRGFAQSPAPTGLLLFRCSLLYSLRDSGLLIEVLLAEAFLPREIKPVAFNVNS